MKKRIIMLLLLSMLAVGTTGVVTYAYLTDTDSRENQLKVTENQIHIEEDFEPPKNPQPGDVIKKKPCVVNDSDIPVYVRVSIHFSDSRGKAQCQPLQINSGWTAAEDGFYYYQKQVSPGQKTDNLFENITLRSTEEKGELVPFDVLIYAESVQCFGFESAEEAFGAL